MQEVIGSIPIVSTTDSIATAMEFFFSIFCSWVTKKAKILAFSHVLWYNEENIEKTEKGIEV
jgi:hypothetical protein